MTPHAANDDVLALARWRLLVVLRGPIAQEADAVAEDVLTRLVGVPERAMRAAVLSERLRRVDAVLAEAILAWLHERALRRRPGAQEVLMDLCLERPLAESLGYDASRRIYSRARALGHESIARIFLSVDGRAPPVSDARPEPDGPVNTKMPEESLGRRKQLARSRDRLALDRLLWDRHPAVVSLLLHNPRLVERDAIRIAAMRPANPDCLLEVFRHPKWIARYRVKVALACNPRTPTDVAESLLPHLMLPELHYIANAATLDDGLRSTAWELIRRRGQPGWDSELPVHRLTEPGGNFQELDGGEVHVDLDAVRRALEGWMASPEPSR